MTDIHFATITGADGDTVLPVRKTKGSAGYDFVSPIDVTIGPGETVKIPTGIKAYMPVDTVLMLYVRSSLGIKKNLVLSNGTGVIDSDYVDNPSNEGEIIGALHNVGAEPQTIKKGEAFMQGVFLLYLTVTNDHTVGERTGGIGSTGK